MGKGTKRKPRRPESELKPAREPKATVAPAGPPRAETKPVVPTKPVVAIKSAAQKSTPLWLIFLQALLIASAVLWIYGPVLHGSWLWDDDYLIENNELVHDPFGILNAWLSPTDLIDYFPLTVSVEWLEWQLWPDNTFCYHLTNVVLHIGSALLFWRLLSKFNLKLAWLGGLIFAVHPAMVESVAWMAEIKNTLSMPPFLLAMCAWIDYARGGRLRDYLLALGLFFIAMLCKTTMVAFPVIILLYAWYRRGRIDWNDVKASLPFFFISIALSLALISLLRHGVGEETIPLGGIMSRLACAGLSLAFYFSKCVLPVGLLPIYPQWVVNPPTPWQLAPWPVLAGVLYWLWTKRETWGRHVLLGFGFFLLNLLPFVGFRAISFMRFVWVMDHFVYLPILGLIALSVAALGQLQQRLSASARPWAFAVIALVLVCFTVGSHRYAKIFVSSEALWTYGIHHFPDAWPAHNNLGNALVDSGRIAEAKEQYEEALRINPGYPEAHNNLGIVLVRLGRIPEGMEQFREALQLCPDLGSAQDNLAKMQATYKPPAGH